MEKSKKWCRGVVRLCTLGKVDVVRKCDEMVKEGGESVVREEMGW